MSKRRLDKLEGALGPKEAVLHWIDEAHSFGSLPAYVESLIDQPEAAQPFIALPAQVERAVWLTMRGQRSGFVKQVTHEAVGDTVFLLRLVIGLNGHIDDVIRVERLRRASLYWWSRALAAEAKPDEGARAEWQRGAATLRGVLSATERARAAAEARYLDGHGCLFPELASAWRDLRVDGESLGGDGVDQEVEATIEQDVQRVVRMARVDGLEAGGRTRLADELADRIARQLIGLGLDG